MLRKVEYQFSQQFDRIKELADKQKISLNILERKVRIQYKLSLQSKKGNPKSDRLQEIADYFGVSTDYLLGRTENPNLADSQNDPAVDNLTKQAIVLFRKETEGLSDSQKERFNTSS